MNKLTEKLRTIELNQQKIISMIFILLLIIYVDFTFVFKQQSKAIKTLSSKITKLKSDISNYKKESVKIQEIKNKELKEGQRPPRKKIISQEQIPLLLSEISNIANKNNVKVIQMRPQSKETPAKEKDKKSASLTPFIIFLDLVGDYNSLVRFISDLENAQSFISIESIKIVRQNEEFFKENIGLALRIYVKK